MERSHQCLRALREEMEVCDVDSNDLRDLLEQAHKQSSTNEEIADETNRYAGLTTLVEDVKE